MSILDKNHRIDDGGEMYLPAHIIHDVLAGDIGLSPSGLGMHAWVKSEEKVGNWKTKGIEIYSSAGWMTITGRANPKVTSDIPEQTEELQKVLAIYFGDNGTSILHIAATQKNCGFHALFQLPLVLLLMNEVSPLSYKRLMSFQSYVIVLSFVFAATITPTPDVFNQTMLAVPVILLYQVSVLAIWIINKRRLVEPRQPVAKYKKIN